MSEKVFAKKTTYLGQFIYSKYDVKILENIIADGIMNILGIDCR
jgi:hypothetical protein